MLACGVGCKGYVEPAGGGRLGPKSSSSEELESELELSSLLLMGSVGGGREGPITLRRLSESGLAVEGWGEGPAVTLCFRFEGLSIV
jgi:hypothetical protein